MYPLKTLKIKCGDTAPCKISFSKGKFKLHIGNPGRWFSKLNISLLRIQWHLHLQIDYILIASPGNYVFIYLYISNYYGLFLLPYTKYRLHLRVFCSQYSLLCS